MNQSGYTLLELILVIVVIGIMAALIGYFNAADEIAKMATSAGVSTEFLSEMGFVAAQSGFDVETLNTAIMRFVRQIKEADAGNKTALDGFKRLGVNVRGVNGELKDVETLFTETSEAISKMENDTEAGAIAMDVFGRSGFKMLPVLKQGKEGIAGLRDEARKLGVTLTADAAKKAENAADAINAFKVQITALTRDAIIPLLPKITSLAKSAGDIVRFFTGEQMEVSVALWERMGISAETISKLKINQENLNTIAELAKKQKELRDLSIEDANLNYIKTDRIGDSIILLQKINNARIEDFKITKDSTDLEKELKQLEIDREAIAQKYILATREPGVFQELEGKELASQAQIYNDMIIKISTVLGLQKDIDRIIKAQLDKSKEASVITTR